MGCAPVQPASTPPDSRADELANRAALDALLPSGSTSVLRADDASALPDRDTWDLGRLGESGLMAVALACVGDGMRVEIVEDTFPVPVRQLGVAMPDCAPAGQLDLSRLAVPSPDYRVLVTAAPGTRWRLAISQTGPED
jgi:hypothetical protein